jgi:hypothetical protein
LPWGPHKGPRGAKIVPGASRRPKDCQDRPGGITKAPGVLGFPRGHHEGLKGVKIAQGASRKPTGVPRLPRRRHKGP